MPRAEQPTSRPPPAVSVAGGRGPVAGPPAPVPPGRSRGTVVLVAALALAGGVAVLLQPPPPPPVEASLRVLDERIGTSLGGVVVVLVETDNRGPAVVVEELAVRAEPVRQPPTTNGVRRIGAASRGGFAVIVQPDCEALPGTSFAARLTVALRTAAGARRDVLLDLGADPALAARVGSLCARGPGT